MPTENSPSGASVISSGSSVLGVELGSTRVKAVLVDATGRVLAGGTHSWENRLVDGRWTYDEPDVWTALQGAYCAMAEDAERRHGVRPQAVTALGVSAMMHGYVALDSAGELLVPFRTWRNTTTGPASRELSDALGVNIPLRWSVAHLYQAALDSEPHLARLHRMTTLAGLVHHRLTDRHVLGVGDASGMFPIDDTTGGYDAGMVGRVEEMLARRGVRLDLLAVLPEVAPAGAKAGTLTPDGAALLDPQGALAPGALVCPPEGDAGTGMVATNAVAPRTGNVSVGTSIFAMTVLERSMRRSHEMIDIVTTPAGDPVAMVHCNNGAGEIDTWVDVFGRFAALLGSPVDRDDVFRVLLEESLTGTPDASGLLAYNFLSGEPVAEVPDGRPLFVRAPGSPLELAGFIRAQLFSAFASLALGLRVLSEEGVAVDVMVAHGGLFRTRGPAQTLLAAALDTPVSVGESASEGGAWGIAVLACYAASGTSADLTSWLDEHVHAGSAPAVVRPDRTDVSGFADFLSRYEAGLPLARTAAAHIPPRRPPLAEGRVAPAVTAVLTQ